MAAKRKKRRAFEKCAVIYLRYSTHNQTDLSIEYQREITEKYCADRGYTVVKYFIDEAKSGTTDKRDSFQAEALFNRVQDKMNDNRKCNLRSGGKRHYMLGGMSKVYCAECGSAMVGAANKSHGKTHRYYVCPKHKPKSCKLKNLRIQLAKELKNSSDPLTYDIIDKIVKRVTVGKDNIEIELHI